MRRGLGYLWKLVRRRTVERRCMQLQARQAARRAIPSLKGCGHVHLQWTCHSILSSRLEYNDSLVHFGLHCPTRRWRIMITQMVLQSIFLAQRRHATRRTASQGSCANFITLAPANVEANRRCMRREQMPSGEVHRPHDARVGVGRDSQCLIGNGIMASGI